MDPEIVGLSGGKKERWLRLHRTEVLDYYDKHGFEDTRRQYCMKFETLERFIDGCRQVQLTPVTKADTALAQVEILRHDVHELSNKITFMAGQYSEFTGYVAGTLARRMEPIIRESLSGAPSLPSADKTEELSLADFPTRGQKGAQ